MTAFRRAAVLFSASLCLLASGCRSYWIDATVENRTGQTVHEIEVDYPSASFGTNSLAPGASMHYRFQVLGSGPVKVDFTIAEEKKPAHAQGLSLAEHQQGTLLVRLLPQGKVEFVPNLHPAS